MRIKAIIFDVDGVLFDSEKFHIKAWEKVFNKRGINLSQREYEREIGISDREFLMDLEKKEKIPKEISIEEILSEKFGIINRLADSVELFPEVKSAIEKLSKKYTLAIASNSRKEFIIRILGNFGLIEYFEKIVTSGEIKNPKPNPEIYLLTAEKLGFSSHECMVIEDTPVGIEAAKKAGMKCLAVSHTFPEIYLKNADKIIEKLSYEVIEEFIESI